MTSLQGGVKLSAEAGRKAQLCCTYHYALAPFDPMVRAKVIGKEVVFLLLGDSLRSMFPASGETRSLRVSIFTRWCRTELDGCLLTKGARS